MIRDSENITCIYNESFGFRKQIYPNAERERSCFCSVLQRAENQNWAAGTASRKEIGRLSAASLQIRSYLAFRVGEEFNGTVTKVGRLDPDLVKTVQTIRSVQERPYRNSKKRGRRSRFYSRKVCLSPRGVVVLPKLCQSLRAEKALTQPLKNAAASRANWKNRRDAVPKYVAFVLENTKKAPNLICVESTKWKFPTSKEPRSNVADDEARGNVNSIRLLIALATERFESDVSIRGSGYQKMISLTNRHGTVKILLAPETVFSTNRRWILINSLETFFVPPVGNLFTK